MSIVNREFEKHFDWLNQAMSSSLPGVDTKRLNISETGESALTIAA